MTVISHAPGVDPALSANAPASPAGAASALPVPGLFGAVLSQTLGQAEGLPGDALASAARLPRAEELITNAALATEQPTGADVVPEDAPPRSEAGEENALLQLLSSLVPASSETPPAAQATLAAEAVGAFVPIAAQPVSDGVAEAIEVAGLSPDGEHAGQRSGPGVASLSWSAAHASASLDAPAPATLPPTLFRAIHNAAPGARAMFSESSALREPAALFEPFLEASAPAAAMPEGERIVRPLPIASSAAPDAAIAAPAGSSATLATAAMPAEKVIHIPQPPSSPAWRDAFASNVRTLVLEGGGVAELRLDPPDLGPVHIRIELAEQTTHVAFAAVREDTRAAIADALPLLKELLAESGIALDGATVNDNVPRREAQPERGPAAHRPADTAAPIELRLSRSDRLVDTYA